MIKVGLQEPKAAAASRNGREPVSVRELLEWAFGVERVSVDFDAFDRPPAVGIEFVMMQQAMLGAQIDGGGHTPKATDAEIVAAEVSALPVALGGRRMAIMVAELARTGGVPDWMPGAVPRLVPSEWKRGSRHGGPMARTEVAGHWLEERWQRHPKSPHTRIRRLKRHEIRYCPCRWSPSAHRIAAARRLYLDWWGALQHLQVRLCYAGLEAFWIVEEMPEMTPWRHE